MKRGGALSRLATALAAVAFAAFLAHGVAGPHAHRDGGEHACALCHAPVAAAPVVVAVEPAETVRAAFVAPAPAPFVTLLAFDRLARSPPAA